MESAQTKIYQLHSFETSVCENNIIYLHKLYKSISYEAQHY